MLGALQGLATVVLSFIVVYAATVVFIFNLGGGMRNIDDKSNRYRVDIDPT
jgi:hypothetical protein